MFRAAAHSALIVPKYAKMYPAGSRSEASTLSSTFAEDTGSSGQPGVCWCGLARIPQHRQFDKQFVAPSCEIWKKRSSSIARRLLVIECIVSEIGTCISSTGNFNIITLVHMKKLKKIALIGNTGRCDNEIDLVARGAWNTRKLATTSLGRSSEFCVQRAIRRVIRSSQSFAHRRKLCLCCWVSLCLPCSPSGPCTEPSGGIIIFLKFETSYSRLRGRTSGFVYCRQRCGDDSANERTDDCTDDYFCSTSIRTDVLSSGKFAGLVRARCHPISASAQTPLSMTS